MRQLCSASYIECDVSNLAAYASPAGTKWPKTLTEKFLSGQRSFRESWFTRVAPGVPAILRVGKVSTKFERKAQRLVGSFGKAL